MLVHRRPSFLVLLVVALLTALLPATAAVSGEEGAGCAVAPGAGTSAAGGGEGDCPIEYVYVQPGESVDFDVPSPYDGSVSVRLAVAPEEGRLTQLGGRQWRYDASGVDSAYGYAWFVVCSGSDCAEVKVVLKVKDLSAPETTIVEGPEATTLETVAEFVVRASEDDVWFKCSLDDGGWALCPSPLRFDGLGVGDHVLKVKAVDTDGNWDETPAVWAWTVGDGSFHDDESSVHESNIERIAEAGITRGCNADGTKFCPDATMTRGQFAAFVNRALALPATDVDHFSDDDDSPFEDDINRLAAAGLTAGCDAEGTTFCPDGEVSRGQIAAFISRILELPAGEDAFDDDDGSVFEQDINRLAAAGITSGCSTGGYCPDGKLTRGQFASLFVRAGLAG